MSADESGPKVLAVDDNEDALFAVEKVLARSGYSVVTGSNGREAIELAEKENPDLIIMDVMMPGLNGYEATKILKSHPTLRYIPLILLTANDDLEDVIFGLEQGADDYMKKPFRPEELIARMKAALRTQKIYSELRKVTNVNHELSDRMRERHSFSKLIGKSKAISQVYSMIERVADSTAPILITGESGTGKELVAGAIHFNSGRSGAAFIVLNCSAFNESLLESELFGHVKGSFSGAVRDKPGLFEVADGGTLFLDELGEMAAPMQAKLLRVLQDGSFMPVGATKQRKVDVRILAATNRDLLDMVGKGAFREDLYYRLNVVNLRIPPLRERSEDIPLLVEHFLASHAPRGEKRLSAGALKRLIGYAWPGNIRQLENEIERLALLSGKDKEIGEDLLSPQVLDARGAARPAGDAKPGSSDGTLKDAVEKLERELILSTLERLKWNKSEAAKALGISRSNLISKVQAYGLETDK